ncbi:MAG: hypothetical protein CVU65_16510 [Deltaproteobacteria bacterium HGW-Deltaproteobacteria-22]|nr:MAG: hypothetical protein CVU65_16510 [Deltaproteobacteria bacterium HGW-Deltaproteobacteria-22]
MRTGTRRERIFVLFVRCSVLPLVLFSLTTPAMAQLPRQDARIISEKCMVTVAADGRAVTECTIEEEVHSMLAMDVFLDPRVRWLAGTQKFTVLAAYSVAPGTGRKVSTPAHAINEVTPFTEELTPLSTPWRETVISHVGVMPGSRLVRRTRLEDLVAPVVPYEARWPLQKVRPIDFLEYRFRGITHLALVDPPAGCMLTGAPPEVTVTCKNVPGVGFSGVGSGRRIEITDELYGRLPRVVVSAWKDAAALAAVLKARRYPTVTAHSGTRADSSLWPEFLNKEMALQPTPVARVETLRSTVMTAFRTLSLKRPPVPLLEVLKHRAVTVTERAMLFDAALRLFVPEARSVRTAFLSDHEVIANRIPSTVEYSNPVVLFSLAGRELIFSPSTGELGPWPSLAAGTWLLDPTLRESPTLVPGDSGPLRAVHAKAVVDGRKLKFAGQATWETFADAPPCAKMLPPSLGQLERCDVLERSPGLIRVGFSSSAELDGEAVATLPGALDPLGSLFRVMPFEAGVTAVFPAARSQVELEFTFNAEAWSLVRVQSGSWVIPHKEPLGYGAGLITPGCRQNFSVHRNGLIRFSSACDLKRRHHYGKLVKPAAGSGFTGGQAYRESLKAGSLLEGRGTVHKNIQSLVVWFRKPPTVLPAPVPPSMKNRPKGGQR